VFLAFCGEGGDAACIWPVPLEIPTTAEAVPYVQLQLLPDDGDGNRPPERRTARRPVPTSGSAVTAGERRSVRPAGGRPRGLLDPASPLALRQFGPGDYSALIAGLCSQS
jgi:hypothetical protein